MQPLEQQKATGRYNYAVVARSDGDTWLYGPFTNRLDAVCLEQQLAEEYPEIEYETTELLNPALAVQQ